MAVKDITFKHCLNNVHIYIYIIYYIYLLHSEY